MFPLMPVTECKIIIQNLLPYGSYPKCNVHIKDNMVDSLIRIFVGVTQYPVFGKILVQEKFTCNYDFSAKKKVT